MHGKQFLIDEVFAGIDEEYVYGRLDFASKVPDYGFEVVVNLESWSAHAATPQRELRLGADVDGGRIQSWSVKQGKDKPLADSKHTNELARMALVRNFEFRLPLKWLSGSPTDAPAVRLRLRFSLWQNRLPVDALPVEGWIELELLPEEDLIAAGG